MWHRKINGLNVENSYPSFTLIEMMISLSLGVVFLFILSRFYSDIIYTQNKQRELINLQQTTHQLLNYFQQHIQHSGYQGSYREESNYAHFLIDGKSHYLDSSNCFLFFYDLNQDGCIGSRNKNKQCQLNAINNTKYVKKELFGFKFDNKQILVFDDKTIDRCYDSQCREWAKSCNKSIWRKITDLSDYTVENLAFKWLISDKLLSIELSLRSNMNTEIIYSATAYSYILNSEKKKGERQ